MLFLAVAAAILMLLPSGWVESSASTVPSVGSTAPATPTFPTPIQHVFFLVLENEPTKSVLRYLTYQRYLASAYSFASNYFGICHPSPSDYIALTSGSTFTQCGSQKLIPGEYNTVNIGDLADQKNLSWDGFFEGMNGPCNTKGDNNYADNMNAFLYYKDIWDNHTRCVLHDHPFTSWYNRVNESATNASAIPNFALFVPNTIDDGHNSNHNVSDLWLANFVNDWILNRSFMSNSVLFITYDEGVGPGGYTAGNTTIRGGNTFLVAISPYSIGFHTSSKPYTLRSSHYDLLSTAEWLLGLGSTGNFDGPNSTAFPPLKGLFNFPTPKSFPAYPYTWTRVASSPSPSPRGEPALAYDATDQYVLFFGGHNNNTYYGDTWTFVGGKWTELNPTVHPSARRGSMMAYDPNCGCVVLFGGTSSTGSQHDTWEFRAGTWTNITGLLGPAPPGRRVAGFDFDAASNEFVLFAGHNGFADKSATYHYFNDTWVLSITGNPVTGGTWTRVWSHAVPDARAEPMMAYDPANQTVILFGGYYANATSLVTYGDTWSFSNGQWTKIPRTEPPPRDGGSMTYDPSLGGLVLFGGHHKNQRLWDTWLWNGKTWTPLFAWPSPPPEDTNRVAFDPIDNYLVNFGGNLGPGSKYIGQTWTFAPTP